MFQFRALARARSGFSQLSESARLCLVTAAGCSAVGLLGLLVNAIWPHTTQVHGLLIVAAFYGLLGFIDVVRSTLKKSPEQPVASEHPPIKTTVVSSRRWVRIHGRSARSA
jgi:hypothetical protein